MENVIGPPYMLSSYLSVDDIEIIKSLFHKFPRKQMDKSTLLLWLQALLKGVPKANHCLKVVFYKLEADCKQRLSWNEFLYYLMLENLPSIRNNDNFLPVVEKPLREVVEFYKTKHRHPILRIAFQAFISKERKVDYSQGKYYTVSFDGTILKWNINFKHEAKYETTCPNLIASKTMITDLICISDLNCLCVSSTERELRFYDLTARSFNLRALIYSVDEAVVRMHYHFFKSIRRKNVLITGDLGGTIRLFEFTSANGGPFRLRPGVTVVKHRYSTLAKGKRGSMSVRTGPHHDAWITQVGFIEAKEWVVSSSNSILICSDLRTLHTKFKINSEGATACFYLPLKREVLYTGGKDYLVRIWSHRDNTGPKQVFAGHSAPIRAIFTQKSGARIYSVDDNRVFKVWDANQNSCLQTFCEALTEIGQGSVVSFYNPWARIVYVGCRQVAAVTVGYQLSPEYSDGFTHTQPVTKLLTHPQTQTIVSMGMDSQIIVWNALTGRRTSTLSHAHSSRQDDKIVTAGITAATFDPAHLYLLTGATDGSIKMWHFLTNICVRTMQFGTYVTSLTWVPQRIFASGWSNQITEWEDSKEVGPCKIWPCSQNDHIQTTSLCWPLAVVTASELGELIFCRISTGQPYRRHLVSRPFQSNIAEDFDKRLSISSYGSGAARKSSIPMRSSLRTSVNLPARRATVIPLPVRGHGDRVGVKCLLTLSARPIEPDVGTLLVSLETGYLQLWSHHPTGRFLKSVYVIHSPADYVRVMVTTESNKYLFTGHVAGYVKVWLLTNFGLPGPKQPVSMPKLRLRFPFLLKDKIEKRAKRAVRNQPEPILLSSFRAHARGISDIALMEENKIFATSSWDRTVRIWTYGGQYIGTLGTFRKWPELSAAEPAVLSTFRIPPDIKKIASSSTLKVLTNGFDKSRGKLKTKVDVQLAEELADRELKKPIYGRKPIKLPSPEPSDSGTPRYKASPQIDISSSQPSIRVFQYYTIFDIETVERPQTPPKFDHNLPPRDPKFEIPSNLDLIPEEEQLEASSAGEGSESSSEAAKEAGEEVKSIATEELSGEEGTEKSDFEETEQAEVSQPEDLD